MDTQSTELLDQDHRSEVGMYPQWVLKLDKRDSLLVLQALGGRLLSPEMVAAAAALGDRLAMQRASAAKQFYEPLRVTASIVTAKEST